MSFTLSDLIIENSIRDGLKIIRDAAQLTDTSRIISILDSLFDFTSAGKQVRTVNPDGTNAANSEFEGGIGTIASKYTFERDRLIAFFKDTEIAIVHSYADVQTHLPCVSIQLAADGEDQGLALTDDFGGIDGTGNFSIGGMTGAGGADGRDVNTIHANATIKVGIHTKEQLLTKYLYHVVKYTILSNKETLIRQNFIIATFRGSDFSRDAGWQGDHVYTRFLDISGKTEDSWVNIDELVADVRQIDLNTYVGRETPDPAVLASEINNPSSEVNTSLAVGVTEIQVANVFGLTVGMSTLQTVSINQSVTPNTRSVVMETIEITDINVLTNIITIAAMTMQAHPVGTTNNIFSTSYVFNGTDDTILLSQVVQTVPSPIQTGNDRITSNDDGTAIHRTTATGMRT